jgi:hypothetical protein
MNRYDIALGKKPPPKQVPESDADYSVTAPILRSPGISLNRTSYVDLSQIAMGDGSEGNPFNQEQFNSGAISTTVRLRGATSISDTNTYSISLTEGNLGRYQGIGTSINTTGIARLRADL